MKLLLIPRVALKLCDLNNGGIGMKGDGVKGQVMKGQSQHAGDERIVNHVVWARHTAVNQDCQNQVDVKALTGRGGLAALRQGVASLDAVADKMRLLSEQSKTVKGVGAYLVVHQRSSRGSVFLRWRQRLGANRHLNWEELEEIAANLPGDLRVWCIRASREAQLLNEEHLQLRAKIKIARRALEVSEPHLYPRSSFSS
ncbi:hypothetical protein NHB13_10160 [Delftia tsuruhatensis]|uniref:hypothetical protein n=1 Tax=Delftia tsuruhatensis TaxID=180282 RepID=UPI0020900220|nr:hypothetical protein [Delftia tsuruhatensis]MCO5336966.1 hypothetical protein [Delftia tsuruhatensis]